MGFGLPNDLTKPHKLIDARDPASKRILLEGAIEGHVLVKNTNAILPLRRPKILSLFGYSATIPGQFDISTSWVLGTEASCPGCRPVFYTGAVGPQIAINGTLHTGGGSGANTPVYISSPYEAIAARAYEDDTQLFWDFTTLTDNPSVDASSDACLVFINAMATEALDRTVLNDAYSDNLILNIASKCANTIVVIHNAGIRLVDAFIDHENVTAVIFAHLPGQDSGRALAAILYGDVSPSGKLPYTVAKNATDYNGLAYPTRPKPPYRFFPQDNFQEGVYIDYRAFDRADVEPRFEFGFGLSYTTFSFSALSITTLPGRSKSRYPSGKIVSGGAEDLWDVLYAVSFSLENTGKPYAKEVAQLYIGIPGAPIRQLRGFEKIGLGSGQNAKVEFELTRRDLSIWDVVAQKWKLQRGKYRVWVGASSRDLRLEGSIKI
jgi:beta-glucosidase